MEKQKKSGPTNDPATFPELNLQTLQGYAELWAEMFPAIQRITLYRSDKGVVSSRYILFVQILYQINHELITALRPAKTEEDRKENEMIRSLLYADKYSQVTLQYLDWSCGHESADHVMDQLGDCYKERQTDLTYRDEWFWLTGSIEDPLPSEFILEHGGRWFFLKHPI